jgi:hypothetical protein
MIRRVERIERLGVRAEVERAPDRLYVGLEEYAVLAGGREVVFDDGRGYTVGGPHAGDEAVTDDDIRLVLLPDDDESAAVDDRPWAWIAELLRERGVSATPEELRALPLEISIRDKNV